MFYLRETAFKKGINIFLIFIVIQPILDVLTSFSLHYLPTNVTIGIVVRFMFMVIALLYICLYKKSKLKQLAIAYIGIAAFIILLSFSFGMLLKPNFSLFLELQFYAKGFYFLGMFSSYVLVFHRITNFKTEQFLHPIVIAMVIIGTVFVVATLTNTGFDTYRYMKAGTKGWFHAGNEIGAVIAIGLPLVLLYAIRKVQSISQVYYWIPSFLIIYASIMIGTKVAYLALVYSIGITFMVQIISYIKNREFSTKLNLSFVTVLLAVVLILSPMMPAFSNTGIHIQDLEKRQEQEASLEEAEVIVSQNQDNHETNKVVKLLLSGRQIFLKDMHRMYMDAPFVQKIFGMGYAGRYTDKPKLIEMDFFDLFYSYGVMGSFLFLLPLFYGAFLILKRDSRKSISIIDLVLISSSLLLGLGIAFIAGHVLFAPSVNIYIAVLLAYIHKRFNSDTDLI